MFVFYDMFTEAQLATAIAKALEQSNAQFTLMDLAAIAGGLLMLLIMAFRYVYMPYRQGLVKPVTKEDFVPRDEAQKAIHLVTDIYNEVKAGNSVILQKDGDGQVSILNIPRWLREMVSSQQRTEAHIQTMVNHQSDVLTAIAEVVSHQATSMEKASKSLETAVTILRQVRSESPAPGTTLP